MRCPSSRASTRRPCWSATPRPTSGSRREASDDMDLFVLVQKLDAYGTPLQAVHRARTRARWSTTSPTTAPPILRYKGSDGRLRASARHLDEDSVDRRRSRPHLRPGREALARRDRRARDRPAADRARIPPRRAAALRRQLAQPPRNDDARHPRVRRRQRGTARRPHRRRACLLPAGLRCRPAEPGITTTAGGAVGPWRSAAARTAARRGVVSPTISAVSVNLPVPQPIYRA